MNVKVRANQNSATFGTRGMTLEIGTAPVMGVTVDNFSGYWLSVGSDGLFVPPYSTGWAGNFYGQTIGSIIIKKSAPGGTVNPASGNDGTVVVALYDTSIIPNPGIPIGATGSDIFYTQATVVSPFQSGDGNLAPRDVTLPYRTMGVMPLFYTNNNGVESFLHIQARQLTNVIAGALAVLAGVDTNTYVPASGEKRLMYAQFSTDTAGLLALVWQGSGSDLWNGYMAINSHSPLIAFGPNGIKLTGAFANLRVRHSANANVAYNYGVGAD